MIRKHSTLLALTGFALMAVGQVHAQNTSFVGGDLLLDFRNISTTSDADVTVDLGNASAFVSTVYQNGGTAVLDSGSGYSASSFLAAPGFSGTALENLLGTPASGNQLGFSAAASDHTASSDGTGLIWTTRTQANGSLTPPSIQSQQQGLTAQSATSAAIYNIGFGSETGTTLSGSMANAAVVASSNPNSYQNQGQGSINTPTVMNYGQAKTDTSPWTGSGDAIPSRG